MNNSFNDSTMDKSCYISEELWFTLFVLPFQHIQCMHRELLSITTQPMSFINTFENNISYVIKTCCNLMILRDNLANISTL